MQVDSHADFIPALKSVFEGFRLYYIIQQRLFVEIIQVRRHWEMHVLVIAIWLSLGYYQSIVT